jgi:hypothetical protein
MTTIPRFPADNPAVPPTRRWWLSLFPRLSAATKRSLFLLSLSAAILINGQWQIGNRERPATTNSPYALPAVQHALQQLGLPGRDPVGPQFQVNSYTTGGQLRPAVAIDSDGDFVAVWQIGGTYSSGIDSGIRGQRYNSVGTAQGSEFQVNNSNERYSDVAMDSDGDFVVIWFGAGGIQGRRYNSAGTAQGSEFQVNSYTATYAWGTAVAMDSDGDFFVAWQNYGSDGSDTDGWSIQGRRFDSAGTPQGSQFQVNTHTTGDQNYPAVALDSDGDVVAVWQSEWNGIQGQRYNSAGTAQGNQFQINTYTSGSVTHPSVSLDSDGDFVVVWDSWGSEGSDTDYESIQGQRFDSAGTAQGSPFQVNSYTTNLQRFPSVSLVLVSARELE